MLIHPDDTLAHEHFVASYDRYWMRLMVGQ